MRVRGADGLMTRVWKTSRASPYSVSFCRHATTLLAEISPRSDFRQRGGPEIFPEAFEQVVKFFASGCSKSERGRNELDEANEEWPTVQAPLPPLPAREPRPWPADAET